MLLNGALWADTSGRPIHAHGGGIIRAGEYYYWFGENREGRKRVSCYRSANLTDWEFRGDVLTLDSPFQPIETRTDPALVTDAGTGGGANIERPKVVYNPLTRQFVMWMHWENGRDYSAARCAIATCDTADGDYVYRGSFNPVGHMSRDCTLFVDDDGTAYFVSAARDNADMHIYRLSEDYLAIDEHVKTLWPGQYREAPALFKRNGVYFLLTSGCTGWEPNQGKYAYARTIGGKWSALRDFGGPTTYDTQPACILPVQGCETTGYLYVGDRWDPADYYRSAYAFLPIEFPDDTSVALHWADAVRIDRGSGRTEAVKTADGSGICRIRTGSNRYLAPRAEEEKQVAAKRLSYSDRTQRWMLEPAGDAHVRIRSACGRYLEQADPHSGDRGEVTLRERADRMTQQWAVEAAGRPGWRLFRNRASGDALTLSRESDGLLRAEALRPDRSGQTFLAAPHYGVCPEAD